MADSLTPKPWYQNDPSGNMTAYNWGGTPTTSSWTSGGLTTAGIQNPFGLKTDSSGAVIDPYRNASYYDTSNYSQPGATTNGSYWSSATGGWVTPSNNTAPTQTPTTTPTTSNTTTQNTSSWQQDAVQGTPTYGGGVPAPTVDIFGNMAKNNAGTGTTGTNLPATNPSGFVAPSAIPSTPQGTSPTQNITRPPSLGANNPFLSNVTTTSQDPNNIGQFITQPNNNTQFATPQTAQQLAQLLGGISYGSNLQGPGMSNSQPMQLINAGKGNGLNAGLTAQTIGQYGSTPGSYGAYLLARDTSGNSNNFPTYDQWASTQPGYNPGTRSQSAIDTPQYLQNPTAPQYQAPQIQQNTSGANQGGDFLTQILSLLSLLGNYGVLNQGYQRPPQLPQQSSTIGNYFSRFA